MAPAYSTFALLPVLLGAFLWIVGLVMLKRGRWPRRVGAVPHCPRCDYILANLASTPRCPECGTTVIEASVVRGERHRKPALAISGALVTLAGLAILALWVAGALGTIDWNRHKPLSWLIRDLDRTATASAAWREIERRMNANLLSEHDLGRLTDRALKLQQSAANNVYDDTLFRLLGQRYLDHKLTAAQQQQFFDGALRLQLEARPVVGAADPLPYWVRGVGRGPAGWWTRLRILEWRLDDGPPHRDQHGQSGSGSFGGWANGGSLPSQPLGKHRLHMKVELATSSKGDPSGDWEAAPYDKIMTRDLDADVQVIPGNAPIAVVTAPSPDVLARLITARLDVNNNYLNANFDAKPLPVNVAFDAFLRIEGKEYRLGSVNFTAGKQSGYGSGTELKAFPNRLPDTADVILRSSESLARTTTNMTQIWQGEILLRNVKIEKPRTQPAATTKP